MNILRPIFTKLPTYFPEILCRVIALPEEFETIRSLRLFPAVEAEVQPHPTPERSLSTPRRLWVKPDMATGREGCY